VSNIGLVLLNNHPSQHIHQSAPMLLLLISFRLLRHWTTRSLNARFVCRAELFCSRYQTRVFLIHSRKEISAALQKTKPATAPGYDNIHVEFLKNLGPKSRTWLSKFFSRMMATHSIPKIWRKAKVIAVEKPGKDPSLAANYRPISLLSVCYKLLERLTLQYYVLESSVVFVEPFSHGTGTLRCLQKEMATYRH